MDVDRKSQLLDEQIAAAAGGYPEDFTQWRDQTEVVLRTVMGDTSPIYAKFQAIRYSPQVWTASTDTGSYRRSGVQSALSVLVAAKKELELRSELERIIVTSESPEQHAAAVENGRTFIVHGHDHASKHELARLLKALTGIEPLILHEQPNKGRVLLEKLEETSATTGYAVVLLTGDDLGRARDGSDSPRARQNVVFELGFFIGAMGRDRVSVLYAEDVELPSDIDGLAYIPLDGAGGWKGKIARELQEVGIAVDWQALATS